MLKTVNVHTTNVAKEILRVAAQYSIPASKLYIEINSIDTFVKDGDSEFVELFMNDFDQYNDEETLRDSSVEFAQEYDVDIKEVYKGYPFEHMQTQIEFEENDTAAYFVIKKGSKLKYYKDLYTDFMNYITEQKLRSNVILYLLDEDYKGTVKQFVDVIEKVKNITFKEDKRIPVSRGYGEIKSVTSEICMSIEESNDVGAEDKEGRVDYANRGFLLSCTEGEQLFEFIKPQQGKHGRNCKGEIIEVETVNLEARPTFTVEDSIEVQDSYENIKYLSTRSGYLVKNGNQYHVSNTIDVKEISFKTTGTINSDLESEISINVIKDNPLEDAIEEGMHVKVQKLSITGSIGRNTKIEARDISVSGQTHNDSFIKCVNADIGLHKGKVTGRIVEVKSLEGGEIIADKAIIKNATRGKIRAKKIEIEILGKHVVMEASEYIHVQKVKGEDNKFIIDSSVEGGFGGNRGDDKTYVNNIAKELKSLLGSLKDSALRVKNNMEPCEKIKASILKSKNQGIEISPTLIKNFKICKVMRVHYKKLKEEVEYKKNQLEKAKIKLSKSGPSILDAEILLESPLRGYNHIIYRLDNPEIEIVLNTNETMNKKIFKLIEDEDGVLKIVNSD